MIKENDWLVATINNPGFTADDFRDVAGMTLDNTQLLSADEYLKSDFIRENKLFTNERGEFNEQKFRDFYKQKTQEFQSFATDASIDNYEYGLWDTTRPADGRVRDSGFKFIKVSNPDFHSIGITGPNQYQESGLSVREIAQMSKIAGRDYSVNDMSLVNSPIKYIKSLFQDPLVLATYDEDTTEINPITGIQEFHPKGSPRLNSDGQYFYEELGGRSTIGKQVLSAFDYLTVDQQGLNAIDFMDSDDKSKSMGGQIMKSIVELVPMAFGNKARFIYGGILAVKELFKAAPMLTNMVESAYHLFDSSQPEESTLANTIAGFGTKFSTSSDDYTQQNPISFGMITNLITDVATQWGQQRAIQKAYVNLTGGAKKMEAAALAKAEGEFRKQETLLKQQRNLNKISEQEFLNQVGTSTWKESNLGQRLIQQEMAPIQSALANRYRIGGDLSLAHMAIISNTDMYETALEHGATKKEAAALSLGSIAGMFSVDKFLGLGEMFLEKPEKAAANSLRQSVAQESEGFVDGLKQLAKMPESPQKYVNIMKKGSDFGKNIAKKYVENYKAGTLGIVGKAFGEGLEETAEELVTDLVKTAGELAGDFGLMSQSDLGAWDNMLLRYGMSFVGGFVGGGIFGAMDVINNPSNYQKQEFENIITYLRNGKKDEINKTITQLEDEGKFASTTLSYRTTEDGSTFLTAQSKEDSQNHYVAQRMRELVTQIDDMLNQNDLKKTDDDLFRSLVLNEQNYVRLKKFLQNDSYSTGYQAEYNKIVKGVLDTEIAIKQLQGEQIDSKKSSDPEYQKKLDTLQKKRDELLQRKENFLSGKESFKYMSKLMFAINPNISQPWYSSNFDSFVYNKTFKDVTELSEVELNNLKQEYEAYKQLSRNLELDKAYEIFSELQKRTSPTLKEFNNIDVNAISKLQQEYSDLLVRVQGIRNQQSEDIKIPIFEKDGTPAADLNQFGTTTSNQVTVVDGVHHATLADGTKVDQPSKQIYITGQEQKGYFELVRDQEDGQYSIHFKPTDKNNPKAFTDQEKDILFKAVAEILPEGARLSTWGELTKGGIHGLERFRNLGFTQVGTRDVKTKQLTDQQKSDLETKEIQQFVDKMAQHGKIDLATYRMLRTIIAETADTIKQRYSQQLLNSLQSSLNITQINSDTALKLQQLFNSTIELDNTTPENIRKILAEDASFDSLLNSYVVDFKLENGQGLYILENGGNLITGFNTVQEVAQAIEYNLTSIPDEKLSSFRTKRHTAEYLLNNISKRSSRLRAAAVLYQAYNILKSNNNIDQNFIQNQLDYLVSTIQNEYNIADETETANLLADSDQSKFITTQFRSFFKEAFITGNDNHISRISNGLDTLRDLSIYGIDVITNFQSSFDNYLNDSQVKLLNQLDQERDNSANPTYKFLNQILEEVGIDAQETLNDLFNRLFSGNYEDFVIEDQRDLDNLQKILDGIKIAETILISAYSGHNASLNRIAKKNNISNIDLAELSPEQANIILNNLRNLQVEIEYYKAISESNLANIALNFLKSDVNFTKAKLQIFKELKAPNGPLVINGINLLEGIDDIVDQDEFVKLFRTEQLFYDNVQKALADGSITIDDLYKSLESYINYKDAREQISSKLTRNINYGSLTAYDKFRYITTVLAVNPSDFYNNLDQFVQNNGDNIVPIPAQIFGARVANAMITNPNFVNTALGYLQNKNNFILTNTTVLTGIAGSGKTTAESRLALGNKTLVVSGPTSQQSQQLKEIFPNAEEQSIQTIMETILGKELYQKVSDPQTQKDYFSTVTAVDDNSSISLKTDKITLQNNAFSSVDAIVIDEATHISLADIQILSYWATKNEKQLILIGDQAQSQSQSKSIDRELSVQWIAPELGISLRSDKYSKYKNQTDLIRISEKLINSSAQTENANNQEAIKALKNIRLKYSNKNGFSGDLLSVEIPTDVLENIKRDVDNTDPAKKNRLAFIGSKDSATYKQLQDAGVAIDFQTDDIKGIQGREFDYVISTIDFTNAATDRALHTLQFTKDLYTIISRSRKGSVVIDRGISNIIGQSQELGQDSDIKSIMRYKDTFLQYIQNQLNSIKQYMNFTAPTQQQSPQNSTPPQSPTSPQTSPTQSTNQQLQNSTPSQNPTTPQPTISQSPQPANQQSQNQTPTNGGSGQSINIQPPAPSNQTPSQSSNQQSGSQQNNPSIEEQNIENSINSIPDQKNIPEQNQEKQHIEENNAKNNSRQSPTFNNQKIQVRAYGNISLVGARIQTEEVKVEDTKEVHHIWLAPDQGQMELNDAEIFMGNQNITTGEQKSQIIANLLHIKSILLYPQLSKTTLSSDKKLSAVAQAIGKNTLKQIMQGNNTKFYIRVTKKGSQRLAGMTNLDNDLLNINGEYVYTVVAKIQMENGKTACVTLGALADPSTWERAITDDDTELNNYQQWLSQNMGETEYEINMPQFMEYTNLITKKPNGHTVDYSKLASFPNTPESEFEIRTQYSVVSPVYMSLEKGKKSAKAYVYVSNYTLYDPSQLAQIYHNEREQDAKGNPVPYTVRKIYVDNSGISFRTLTQESYKQWYTTQGRSLEYFPFEKTPVGIEMFQGIWNYRADLIQFLKAVGYTKNDIDNIDLQQEVGDNNSRLSKILSNLRQIQQQYYELSNQLKRNVAYAEFKQYLVDNGQQNLIEEIDNINAELSKTDCRFRLGYSKSGAYIGKDNWNPNNQDNCIFTNPVTAIEQLKMLNILDEKVFSRLIDLSSLKGKEDQKITIDKSKGWINVFNKKTSITVKLPGQNRASTLKESLGISKLPYVLQRLSIAEHFAMNNVKEASESKYYIKVGKDKTSLLSIDEFLAPLPYKLESGISYDDVPNANVPKNYPGILITGNKHILLQTRVDNMWDLIFHGAILGNNFSTFETSHHARYEKAPFKYGIFSSPMKGKREQGTEILTASPPQMFRANAFPAFPLMLADLSPKSQNTTSSTQQVTQTQQEPQKNELTFEDGCNSIVDTKSLATIQVGHNGVTMSIIDIIKSAFSSDWGQLQSWEYRDNAVTLNFGNVTATLRYEGGNIWSDDTTQYNLSDPNTKIPYVSTTQNNSAANQQDIISKISTAEKLIEEAGLEEFPSIVEIVNNQYAGKIIENITTLRSIITNLLNDDDLPDAQYDKLNNIFSILDKQC